MGEEQFDDPDGDAFWSRFGTPGAAAESPRDVWATPPVGGHHQLASDAPRLDREPLTDPTGPRYGETHEGFDVQPTDPAHRFDTAKASPTGTPLSPAGHRGRSLATLGLVAILAGGIGGGSAIAVDHGLRSSATSVTNTVGSASSSSSTADPTTTSPTGSAGSSQLRSGNAVDWDATAKSVSASVVSILVSSGQSGDEGTGVVLDSDGHIVTNNHVVSSVNGTIKVQVGNALYPATIVGTDPSTDLAVLKVSNLPRTVVPITFADSSSARVGDPVMAAGNPLGLSGTVTTGIVSALNRPVVTQQVSSTTSDSGSSGTVYTNAIQTSAPINPGNSGGALVNAAGQLIGINSSIASLSDSETSTNQSGSIGIGFAIPSDQVRQVTQQLIATGSARHAYLGISTVDGTAESGGTTLEGASVSTVGQGTPAASAGLQSGDLITAMNHMTVATSDALIALVRSASPGQHVSFSVVRQGRTINLSTTLGTAPTTSDAVTPGQGGVPEQRTQPGR